MSNDVMYTTTEQVVLTAGLAIWVVGLFTVLLIGPDLKWIEVAIAAFQLGVGSVLMFSAVRSSINRRATNGGESA